MLSRVCLTTIGVMGVDGAGLSIFGEGAGPLCTHGRWAEQGEELQLMLGEGPCQDAYESGVMVEEPDLASPEVRRWPGFREAMAATGVVSVAAFPLLVGAARFGALTMYASRAGSLSDEQVADGYVLAQVASHLLMGAQARTPRNMLMAEMEEGFARLTPLHQATGMVMAQLLVDVGEAFVRLRTHAFAVGRPLLEVAADVVSGRLVLTSDD